MPIDHRRLQSVVPLVLAAFLAVSAGCAAQGEMTDVWHDPAMTPGSIHKIFVVAIRKDPVRRRIWEDAFVRALERQGVVAIASYQRFREAPPDTQQVIEVVSREGYDAVLTTTRLPDEATSYQVQGDYRQQEVFTQDRHGYARMHSYWMNVQDPAYTRTDTILRLQTDMWAVSPRDGHLVWSGTLSTLESVPGRTARRAVNDAIMPELLRQDMLSGKPH